MVVLKFVHVDSFDQDSDDNLKDSKYLTTSSSRKKKQDMVNVFNFDVILKSMTKGIMHTKYELRTWKK